MSRLLFIATAALVATSACAKNIAVNWSSVRVSPNSITAAKGDTITFTWCNGGNTPCTMAWSGNHNVYQVAKDKIHYTGLSGRAQCDFAARSRPGSQSTINLGETSPVTFTMGDKSVYFGCQVAGHCAAGQHLAVTLEVPEPIVGECYSCSACGTIGCDDINTVCGGLMSPCFNNAG